MLGILLTLLLLLAAAPAEAQIPPEWENAARVVIGDIESDTPRAAKPWTHEMRQGWSLARTWRQHNHGNIEIILAEYLTFTALCREHGCGGNTIAGKGYGERAAEVKSLIAANGGAYGLVAAVHAWLGDLDDPTGAAAKDAALWSKDPDAVAADAEKNELYALDWLLARSRPTGAAQAAAFTRLALLVQQRGWVGTRCLDIAKVATVLDAPPKVESCQ